MKNDIQGGIVALSLMLGLTAVASAATPLNTLTHTFNVSSMVSNSSFATSTSTQTYNFGTSGTIARIDYYLTYQAFGFSYVNEATIALGDVSRTLVQFISAGPSAPGSFVNSGTQVTSLASNGTVVLTAFETFVDDENPDAIYGPGSYVTVYFSPVPEPSTTLFGAVGALGLVRRRRRCN